MNKIYLSLIALFIAFSGKAQISYGFDYPKAFESFSSRDTDAYVTIALYNANRDSTIVPYSAILSVDDNSSTAKNNTHFNMPGQQKIEFKPGQLDFRNIIKVPLKPVPDNVFFGTRSFKLNLTTLVGFTAANLIGGFSEIVVVLDYDGSKIGIPRVSKDSYVLYPNPVKDVITVEGVDCKNTGVFDVMGKMVLNPVAINNKINIDELTPGIYMLKIVTDKGLITHKIIKE